MDKPPGQDSTASKSTTRKPRGRAENPRKQYRERISTDTASEHPIPSSSTTAAPSGSSNPPQPQPRSRRSRFNAKITQPTEEQAPSSSSPTPKPKPKYPRKVSGDDLTSTLTNALRTAPYPDCPICFNSVRPDHQTWSCSPPLGPLSNDDKERSQCCWTTFHLKCIRSWAEKSVKAIVEAWRARGEVRQGEWRCPGCQTKRKQVPTTYWCFCYRTSNPSPPRMSTPHSCALPCSRPRLSGCGHPCPLPCHPGPCPPCRITVRKSCFCGKSSRNIGCKDAGNPASSDGSQQGWFSCTDICNQSLSCKNASHKCKLPCHPGPCPPCEVTEEIRCWCGRDTKVLGCGEMISEDAVTCTILDSKRGEEETWIGRYRCEKTCNRPFVCGQHTCSKPCHPPSRLPPPCPFDPAVVTHCACGRYRVSRVSDSNGGKQSTTSSSSPDLPARTSCTAPLPTCPSICSKVLLCEHTCKVICHWGTCPPCTEQIEQPCRCGSTKQLAQCGDTHPPGDESLDSTSPGEIICSRPCRALRTCGRHHCGRLCCPLASVIPLKRKGKARGVALEDLGMEAGRLHECDIPCKRVLGCGNHRCERKDHPGTCGICLRSTFEELICPCGRTALEPPIACGTRLVCTYPCSRPPPSCGHPHVPHACHENVLVAGADTAEEGLGLSADTTTLRPCPPCPWLTSKRCACGKKMVDNVQCSQARVHCGTICGRLLPCGFHQCQRTCHEDECGGCAAVCGKSRKSCLPEHHPCTQTCHAPAACPDTEPCLATVTLTCPCGNLRSMVPCSSNKHNITCNNDCSIKKRNARLAEAFGIAPERHEAAVQKVVWSDELTAYARLPENIKFVRSIETTFADFIKSDRRAQVLPHMPLEQRKFIQGLASVYRMDTSMVDQEPHRSVQLIRRIDTRIPSPLLGQETTPPTSLGKLIDLRSPAAKKALESSLETPKTIATKAKYGTTRTAPCPRATSPWGGSSRAPSPRQCADTDPPPYAALGPDNPPVPSSGLSPGRGAWVSPSVQAQRVQVTTLSREVVPDNWEDDT
ncbi:hypothetical protein J3A83DRAFT_1117042 [Scleroderma citrinum]